ncbi:MAG: adenosylcobinamide kinase/adenosylcobinamide phosphate guanyltransferase, partial [Candidatus Aenigmarchaeota archaeon]|nr:adenosylcobinamide kinase/adenosylcobinamide phosphate guanyltransferase [Candidatus Aenigmarchaeota archaeon]
VSNEVGMGIVPEDEMARRFRDMAGILNQKVAEVSNEVFMLVAGIPLKIKSEGEN